MHTPLEIARTQMINQQVRSGSVLNPNVLSVLAAVPREQFVPPNFRNLAFADTAIPLLGGASMLTPHFEGLLLQSLGLKSTDLVLQVGAGSGFLSACLGRLANRVTALEIIPELANIARHNLRLTSTWNAEVKTQDVFDWQPGAHYDVIAVTGSIPLSECAFPYWLAPGGRLFLVTGDAPLMRAQLITRKGPEKWHTARLFETSIPALLNTPQPSKFIF